MVREWLSIQFNHLEVLNTVQKLGRANISYQESGVRKDATDPGTCSINHRDVDSVIALSPSAGQSEFEINGLGGHVRLLGSANSSTGELDGYEFTLRRLLVKTFTAFGT
jgi:hypothetical protein